MSFILAILFHILADYYCQSKEMAANKANKLRPMLLHSLVYLIAMVMAFIWFSPLPNVLLAICLVALSHLIIDLLKIRITRMLSSKRSPGGVALAGFFIDQILHLLIIYLAASQLIELNILGQWMISTIHALTPGIIYKDVLFITIIFLLIWKPSALLVRMVFDAVLPPEINEDGKTSELTGLWINSGTLIGVLERTIVLILGLNGQIGAIGFVLAAKSLARFSQLNSRIFAEKYLIGTFSSMILTLLCVFLGIAWLA